MAVMKNCVVSATLICEFDPSLSACLCNVVAGTPALSSLSTALGASREYVFIKSWTSMLVRAEAVDLY